MVARKASPEEKARLWPMLVGMYAPYEDYQQRPSATFPS